MRLTNTRAAIGGISYVKFNFGPPLFLYLLFRRGLRAALWSGVPAVIGSVLVWLWLPGTHTLRSFIHFFPEPLVVSQLSYSPAGYDNNLMDVLQTLILLIHGSICLSVVNLATITIAILTCVIAFYFAIYKHRGSSIQWQMALVGLLGYALFRHHPYDEIVLIFPFCYALMLWREARAKIVLFVIGYHWYVQRLFDAFNIGFYYIFMLQFALLIVAGMMIYQMRTIEQRRQLGWNSDADISVTDFNNSSVVV
jgi:hypothetical protein